MKEFMKLATAFVAGVLCATAFLAIAAVTVIDQALDNIQVSSMRPGPLWIRWDNKVVNMFVDAQCWYATDAELTTDRVQQNWAPLRSFLNKAIAKFGVTPLTADQRAFCGLPKLPGTVTKYQVTPSGTAISRPLYDAAAYLAVPSVWKQFGNVAVGTVCEDAVIRKTTAEYHYVTNANGHRGLAICNAFQVVVPPSDPTITAPNGTIVTPDGTWTFGTATAAGGFALVRDGLHAGGGYGTTLTFKGGVIYTGTLLGAVYKWTGTGWVQISAIP